MAKNCYYFPHDSNAKDDEKNEYMIHKYGLTAYGVYWLLVEKMHEQADGKLTCNLLVGITKYNIDITLLEQIYNDLITVGLFVTDGEKYWSERVFRNKTELQQKRESKSKAGKLGMANRWGKSAGVTGLDNTVITPLSSVNNRNNKVKESKVKESKGKDIYKTAQHLSISEVDYKKLVAKYGEAVVDGKIEYAKNYAKLKNYVSLYKTLDVWLRKDVLPAQSNAMEITPEQQAVYAKKYVRRAPDGDS